MTAIIARFGWELTADQVRTVFPPGASAALAGTEVDWQPTGLPRRDRRTRMWLSTWSDINMALDHLDRRASLLPVLSEAEESLVALGIPFLSRGEVNWSVDGKAASLFPALGDDPGSDAPVMVMTTLGLVERDEAADAFAYANQAVRSAFSAHPDVAAEVQMLPDLPFLDGPTISLWSSQDAMLQEAYAVDPHRSAMQIAGSRAGRGSYTRMQIRHLEGSWAGLDAASVPW